MGTPSFFQGVKGITALQSRHEIFVSSFYASNLNLEMWPDLCDQTMSSQLPRTRPRLSNKRFSQFISDIASARESVGNDIRTSSIFAASVASLSEDDSLLRLYIDIYEQAFPQHIRLKYIFDPASYLTSSERLREAGREDMLAFAGIPDQACVEVIAPAFALDRRNT